jgi:succinate dehydrogenase hydrophobic anchor subunit
MRPRDSQGRRRNPTFEMIVTAIMLVVLVGSFVVFVFVYHDLPFRLSGP